METDFCAPGLPKGDDAEHDAAGVLGGEEVLLGGVGGRGRGEVVMGLW